jgi:hypothetical protein
MKMVKERTHTMSAVNEERRQVLTSNVIWDGTIDCFEVFRNYFEFRSHAIRLDQQYKEKLQDRFTILANYPIDPRRIKSKRSQH